MDLAFTASARRLAIGSAIASASLGVIYTITLAFGLLSLPSPDQPIPNPLFSILEILIILMMPAVVALMVGVHAWASRDTKPFSVLALVFMSVVAGLTCSLHFVILTLSRKPVFAAATWASLVFAFKWPSVAYAIDILAWDVFFPLSVLCAAGVFGGSRLARSIRALLIASGLLALAGLSGVVFADMQLRNIGIVGYAVLFPIAEMLLALLFYRTAARQTT